MALKIGIMGKPNSGKSTLFSALTGTAAAIGNYPFTTINTEVGVAYIKNKCPHTEINVQCSPNYGRCVNGYREIPIEVADVPGLVEGANEGKGMGNQFLDSVSDLSAIVNLINPLDDSGKMMNAKEIESVGAEIEGEIFRWFASRLSRDWTRSAKKEDASESALDEKLISKMSFFGISRGEIRIVLSKESFSSNLSTWSEEDFMRISRAVFTHIKPIIRVVNKGDLIHEGKILEEITTMGYTIISADYELSIWKALNHGLIKSVEHPEPEETANPAQKNALKLISDLFSTGKVSRITDMFSHIVYNILSYIVVYPVFDESKWTDKKGTILPDTFLMPKKSTAEDLAYKVHTDIGEGFIKAIDGRTRMILGRTHELKDGDVIRIVSKTK
ncbi:MAG: YchF-related putative GTPase [Thermoplasmataceae archaeon]